mmetsp:Transcript_11159/g.25021  ORF Transcript_11159/g.25021 Transcript_11159/m.25021 type:complete len:296 (+) Transcript_11159:463-1350(+)
MNPPRRLAETSSKLSGLTLHQYNFSLGPIDAVVWLCQSTSCLILPIDAPFLQKLISIGFVSCQIVIGIVVVMQKEFGHVEADATGSNNGNLASNGLAKAKDVDVGQYVGMVETRDWWYSRIYSGSHNPSIDAIFNITQKFHIGKLNLRPQLHFNLPSPFQLGQPVTEVANRFVELLLTGYALGHVELSADLAALVVQDDAMSNRCRGGRECHPRRSGTNDANGQPFFRGDRILLDGELRLVTGQRVDQTAGRPSDEGMIEAGLVAGDAGIDVIDITLAGLPNDIRIGKERSGHAN